MPILAHRADSLVRPPAPVEGEGRTAIAADRGGQAVFGEQSVHLGLHRLG